MKQTSAKSSRPSIASPSPTASSSGCSTRSSPPTSSTAARTLRNRNSFTRDDGTPLNYTLVNIKDWCKNTFEVVNQLRINTDNSHHRYDVILLINGVPVRADRAEDPRHQPPPGDGADRRLQERPRQRLHQARCSASSSSSSSATATAPTTSPTTTPGTSPSTPTSGSCPIYQFAAEDNTKITHLDDFADTFLAKCTLGQMISRYMVLVASEQKLLMMRPYQIYAVKHIVDCIDQNCGNGYVWHTTGSGKTLTSFKASTLLKDNPTSRSASSSSTARTSTARPARSSTGSRKAASRKTPTPRALVRRLLSDDYADKVIVSTIQKLGLALDENSKRNKQRKKDGQRSRSSSSRSATSAWSSSSTSATARSSARTTRPSRSSSPTPSSSASPARRSSRNRLRFPEFESAPEWSARAFARLYHAPFPKQS